MKKLNKRLLSVLLALVLCLNNMPFSVFSVGNGQESGIVSSGNETTQQLPWDYDSMYIAQGEEKIYYLDLLATEKVEISANGLTEAAQYQWQVEHPEKDGVWINIYDGTQKDISVTIALVENVLREGDYARLRCRAYTEKYAYQSNEITVYIVSEKAADKRATKAAQRNAVVLAEENDEFVTVEIRYVKYEYVEHVDDKGVKTYVIEEVGEAYGAYVATLRSGSSLNVEVPNPVIVGFDANLVLAEGQTGATMANDAVVIALSDITQSVSFRVEFHPAKVNYSTYYYFQNIYDDLYVENTAVAPPRVLQGYTGDMPSEEATQLTVPGFTALFYEPDIIAGDGSTVFNVYYERNYYIIEFDCDGGYGTDSVYVRYGTYIAVANPVRTGYSFIGWDLVYTDNPNNKEALGDNVKNTLPETLPDYNSGYVALWDDVDTTYTVVYWVESRDGTKTFLGSRVEAARSATKVSGENDLNTNMNICGKVNHTHSYSCGYACGLESHTHSNDCKVENFQYMDPDRADKNVTVNGDGSTVVNVYYKWKLFEIRYVFARSNKGSNVQIAHTTGNGNLFGGWGTSNVVAVPTVSDRFVAKSEEYNGYTIHYIAVRAEFGANIESLWPSCDINDVNDTNGYYRRFGSWAAEDGTPYREYDADHANVVGAYPYMSAEMIKSSNLNTPLRDETTGETYYLAQRMSAWWGGDPKLVNWYGPIDAHSYHIYIEAFDGEGDREYKGKQYDLAYTLKFTCAHNGSTRVDPFSYEGLTCVNNFKNDQANSVNYQNTTANKNAGRYNCPNTGANACEYCNCFYYDRSDHNLSFFNFNTMSEAPASRIMMYGQALKTFNPGTPSYPTGIEPGAYEFQGWYTTPEWYEETRVNWETLLMPDADFALYAKWTPVNRNVYFHLTYDDVATNTYWQTTAMNGNPVTYPIVVPHGAVLGTTYNYIPQRTEDNDNDGRPDYTFIGWFYMDGENKKRFAPDSMEIKRDLHLFAEWQTLIDTEYYVDYVLKNEETVGGVLYQAGTVLATATEGHSTAGRTKTFTAKAGGQLLAEFSNAPLFPQVNTHSILMNADSGENRFTFEYILDPEVYYKVRYVDKVTGDILGQTADLKTSNAIVTEKYKFFDGYVPEQFYIRKVLAADGGATSAIADNIITFYYLPNTTKEALYNIEYYKWNQLTKAYDLVQSEPGRGTIDQNISVSVDAGKFTGFYYKNAKVVTYNSETSSKETESTNTTLTGKLEEYGLLFKIYYDPNQYPYVIRFIDRDDHNNILGYGMLDADGNIITENGKPKVYTSINDVKNAKANFEAVLNYTAPDQITADGRIYNFLTGTSQTQSLTIRIESNPKDATTCTVNILTFYYMREVVPIEYHAVCTVPEIIGGNVSQSSDTTPQNPQGCDAMKLAGFAFMGWYYDAECNHPVPASWLSDLLPNDGVDEKSYIKPPFSQIEKGEDGKEHYYALFKPITLKITQKNMRQNDSTVYEIVRGGTVVTRVMLTGTESVTIYGIAAGDYVIREMSNWSWTYSDPAVEPANGRVTVVAGVEKEVVFDYQNRYQGACWLFSENRN